MTKTIEIPLEFANADCLQRALYRLADRCSWNVKAVGASWEIQLDGSESPDELEAEFKRIVIDYSLREKIRTETEQVRTLLFAHAFSSASKSDPC